MNGKVLVGDSVYIIREDYNIGENEILKDEEEMVEKRDTDDEPLGIKNINGLKF